MQERGGAVDQSPGWLVFDHYTHVPSTTRSESADEMTVRHLPQPDRSHAAIAFLYLPARSEQQSTSRIGMVTSMALAVTPTSHGKVTLASTNPITYPLIGSNYYCVYGCKESPAMVTLHPPRTNYLRSSVD